MFGIYLNHDLSSEQQRRLAFRGDFMLISNIPASVALCDHALECMQEAFAGMNPFMAQHQISKEEFIQRATPLKKSFTNGQTSKELLQKLLIQLSHDPERTYFDVPRLRVVPSHNYLSAGISYAYKPHRDLWYAAPRAQVNFWMPVHTISPECAMSLFPNYWDQPIQNSSASFDYDFWKEYERPKAETLMEIDDRNHPLPLEEIDTHAEVRIAGNKGDMLIFSGAHLHATAYNNAGYTRFSIDFRIIHLDDIFKQRGAPNIDTQSTGNTLKDYLRVSDFEPLNLEGIPQHVESY